MHSEDSDGVQFMFPKQSALSSLLKFELQLVNDHWTKRIKDHLIHIYIYISYMCVYTLYIYIYTYLYIYIIYMCGNRARIEVLTHF